MNLLHDPAVIDTFTGTAAVNATMVNVSAVDARSADHATIMS